MSLKAPLPALLTITSQANTPRYPHAAGIFRAYREQTVEVWGAKEVNAEEGQVGLEGSPTQVKRSFAPEPKGAGEMLSGSDKDKVTALVGRLRSKNLI